jgi:hypothetical protein
MQQAAIELEDRDACRKERLVIAAARGGHQR